MTAERLLPPAQGEPKSGCLYCPLLPWSLDFDQFRTRYQRDSAKLIAKEPEGHVVRSRCVEEPWEPVDVLFVGEAPGGEEDKQGLPFVGRSGKLLRRTVEEVFKPKAPTARIAFANTVRCRPPRNRDPSQTEIRCCSPRLFDEIVARQPKLVVVLGNKSLETLTGHKGITRLAGKIVDTLRPEFPGLKVLACLHPAYILRFDHELDRFVGAIETAADYITGAYKALPGKGVVHISRTIGDVRKLLTMLTACGDEITHDCETGSLTPFQDKFPALLSMGFSCVEGESWVIPIDHVDAKWTLLEMREIEKLLADYFTNPKIRKVAQNGKFDRSHIRHRFKCDPESHVQDTMLIHAAIDERRGVHGLDILAHLYTGMGGYDKPLERYYKQREHKDCDPKRGGSFANIPGPLLFEYNGDDADVTKRVLNALRREPEYAENPRLQRIAEVFMPELASVLADMEYAGAQVDVDVVAQLDEDYRAKIATVEAELVAHPDVARFVAIRGAPFNPNSDKQLQTLLYGYCGLVPVKLTDGGLERMSMRFNQAQARWRDGGREGPKPRFRDVIAQAIERKEWTYFSTDADALQQYARSGNTLVPLMIRHREYVTLYETFIEPLRDRLDKNQRVHGTLNPVGTGTGRLSSSGPNLQNIPNKGGGRIKRAYVSRFGDEGLLGQWDYSQIELRIAASLSGEPTMVKAYREGADLHAITGADIADMTLTTFLEQPKDFIKEWRLRAKRINFGCVPMDTRALTSDGWKGYADLCVGDLVAGYRNGELVWTPVREKFHYDDAPLVEVRSGGFCAVTTPDHRWVGHRRRQTGHRGPRWTEPCFTTTAVWGGDETVYTSAPLRGGSDRSGLTPDEAAVLGWIVTDGHVYRAPFTGRTSQAGGRRRKLTASVFQSMTANPVKVVEIDALFARFAHSRYVRPSGIVQWQLHAQTARDLWANARMDELSLEEIVVRMGDAQRSAFLRACCLAEGHRDRAGCQLVTQNQGPALDAMRLAAFLAGWSPRETVKGRYKGRACMSLRFCRPFVTGQRIRRKPVGRAPVWCIRTDCDTWVVRQGDRIMLTGNSVYGAVASTLQRTLRKDGVFLPMERCADMLDRFFDARPVLKRWIDDLRNQVRRTGYVETFAGHRRRVPEVMSDDEDLVERALRQAVNSPVQGGAATLTNMALVLIARWLKKEKMRSQLVLTVHDSIVADMHVDEFVDVMHMGREIMETLPKLSDQVLPGLDWAWLKVPIVADCEVGQSWGQLVEMDTRNVDIDALWGKMAEKAA